MPQNADVTKTNSIRVDPGNDRTVLLEKLDGDDLRSLAQGNFAGLNRLVARYEHILFRYIHSRVGDIQTCEDLIQEVFMRISRQRYDTTAAPITWIFTIARNRVVDHFRQQQRSPRTLSIAENHDRPDPRSADPARKLIEQDADDRIRRWLTLLPNEQAEAVRLRIIGRLSFAEAAEVLGCSVPTCKSRVRYGLTKLKIFIEQENRS
jgi:RNA polymerase sigma-70 factor (ECF subfamily)